MGYLGPARRDSGAVVVLPVTERRVRDSGALFLLFAFLGFLGYIIWDGVFLKEVDINLILHGHDNYGNICGRNNKPVKLADKSGKNYTSKPYTKYTLINAQFERYTLDSNKLKHGELLYIKEMIEFGNSDEVEANSNQTAHKNGDATATRLEQASQHPFERMLDRQSDPEQSEQQIRHNRSLLRDLKSTAMYQYPPMYGYNPYQSSVVDIGSLNIKSKQQQQQQRDNALKLKETAAPAVSAQPRAPAPQTERDLASAMSQTSSPATVGPLSAQIATTVLPNQPIVTTTLSTQLVEASVKGDRDSYEHVLVRPRTSITTNSLSHNEVASQLLYLTECVEYCPSDHVELIFYRCIPQNWRFSLFPNAINVTRTFIDDIITDLSHCYRELIYIISLALVLSVALLILLRLLASIIIWLCLMVVITVTISMACYGWLNYYYQIIDLNIMMPHDSGYAEKLAASDKWLLGSILLTFLSFAAVGTIIFMRKRIMLVTTLFRESGKAISDMPLLLLQPVLTFTVLALLTFLWTLGLICLQSVKSPVIDLHTGFVVFKAEALYKIMKWYHIFAFLWICHFAIACQHYVIGAAVSKWYFSSNRYALSSPIGSSVSELILYYLGSVALGSFLVAIFKVIKIITRQIQFLVQHNCMSPQNSNDVHPITNGGSINSGQLSTSCCGSLTYIWRLFIWFFDNIVMIINRDAYVEIAIHGHSFLNGAQRALTILASNPLKLLAIKSVGNVLLNVAKICVVFGTVSMALILLEEKNHTLNYSWSPVVVSAIFAYVIAHWFLSVYEMVIDALFICYCEDHERAKNSENSNQVTGNNFVSEVLNPNNSTLY